MDAAKFSKSKTALLFSLALLIPAGAFAQTPAFNLQASNTNATSVTLIGNQSSAVSVMSTLPGTGEIPYSATTTYAAGDPNWLCLNPSPAGVINGTCDNVSNLSTPDTLYIQIGQQANSSQLTQSLHTATITLTGTTTGAPTATITVNYTPGSSSGNTVGLVASSPSAITQSVGNQGFETYSFQLTSTSPTPVQFTLVQPTTTNPNATWATNFITAYGSTTGTVYAGSSASVSVTFSGAGQVNNTTLNTNLQVNYGSGNTLLIPVTFGNGVNVGGGGTSGSGSLSFSQTTFQWSSTSGSFPASSTVTVSSTAGAISFGVVVQSTNNWLQVTPASGTLPATLTLSPTGNVAALATGVYTGTVIVNGSDNSSQSIYVYLTVNGGSTNGLTVSPNPIALQTPVNGSTVSQSVTVTSTTGGSLSASASGTGITATVTNSSIAANQATNVITVYGNPTGLSNGTYIGTLTVTAGGVSQAVQVNFVVGTGSGSTGGSTSSIVAAPSALNFIYQIGSGISQPQSQQLFIAGSGNYTATANTQTGGNWLTVSSPSGTLPASAFYVYANAGSLAAGTYTGSVTFTNTGTSLTSVVSVTLVVTGSTIVYATPSDLIFNYIAGTTSAAQFQTVTLASSSNSPLAISAAVSNPANTPWLTVSSNGYTATPAILSVTVNATNLANGLYTGYVTVTTAGTNTTLTIPVALDVVGSSVSTGGTGSLTLSTSALTFTPAVNGVATTQQLAVSATTATSFTATASTTGSGCNNTWLSISPSGSSVTNTTITVTANPAGLPAGTCSGQITLVSNSGTQTVPVTMIVGGSSGTSGSITVTANGGTSTSPSLTFTAQSVGGSVTTQYLTVTSAAGSSGVTFAASLSGSNCTWVNLGITPNQQYSTPVNNLNIGATTTGLAAGTYNCTLSLTPTGGTAVTVPLTLTVIGVPTISIATTTLNFSYSAGSATPASQTIQVTGTGASAPSFTATATSTPTSWLSVSPASGSVTVGSPTALTVSVNPANLAAGTYTGTVSIAAGSGSSGSGTVTVTLTVTAPTPAITTIVNGASFLGGAISPGEFVSLLGTQLGPITPLGPALDSTGKIATTLGNVQVFFGGTPAAITYVSSTQINCTVPYEVAGLATIPVQVKYLAQPSNTVTMNVATSAPGIFTATGTGTGQGAILNQNFTLNTAGNPAAKGTIIQIYMTGEGVTSPTGTDGAITPNATTVPVLPIAVKIGGQPASIVFEGEAPGIVAGVLQLNVMVPATVSSGPNTLVVTIGNNSSQSGLTVAIQ